MWAESGVGGASGERGVELWEESRVGSHSALRGEEPGGVNVPLGSGDAVAAAMSVSPAGENSSLDEYAIWSVRTMLHNQEIT